MVSFQLGKEIEKVFLSNHKHGTKKKFRVLMRNQTSDLQIPHSDAFPTLMIRQKIPFSTSLPSSKLTISHILFKTKKEF